MRQMFARDGIKLRGLRQRHAARELHQLFIHPAGASQYPDAALT